MSDDPDLSADPGWEPAGPFLKLIYGHRRPNRSFVSGEADGSRLRVRYFERDADGALVGKVWFGPGCEGPPGYAHGGAMSSLMDEALGFAAWQAGHTVVAAKLTLEYRDMLPLGTVARFEAAVERVQGRKITMAGRLESQGGHLYAEARGLFIVLRPEALEALKARV